MAFFRNLISVLLLATYFMGQVSQTSNSDKSMAEFSLSDTQIVEENDYFRVFRMQVTPADTKDINQHGRDVVLVPFGENIQLISKKSPEPINLKNETAGLLPIGSVTRVQNSGNSVIPILIVELKQHWEPEMRMCSEAAKCTHAIRMGEMQIGETTSIFTNGFVTAYQHRLDPRGTLDSSYYSAKGKDHLLLIALSDIEASFDGVDEALKAGQSYASDATQIEVNAGNNPVRWMVIRVEIISH